MNSEGTNEIAASHTQLSFWDPFVRLAKVAKPRRGKLALFFFTLDHYYTIHTHYYVLEHAYNRVAVSGNGGTGAVSIGLASFDAPRLPPPPHEWRLM